MFPTETDEPLTRVVIDTNPATLPDFDEWDNHALLVYLAANIFAVRQLANTAAENFGPLAEKLQKNPLFKLLG